MLISLQDATFGWGGPVLLDGASMTVAKGERVGLVGRNGAGKSTLLGVLDGSVHPDDGQVVTAPGVTVGRLVQEVPQDVTGSVLDVAMAGAGEEEWEKVQSAEKIIDKLGLSPDLEFSTLSSGMKRRALLARVLVGEPDVLLLDEPTNHLDIESIAWLERFLGGYAGAVIFVTHDRRFLQALATRIVEVDRGRLLDWECDYPTFLKRKEDVLANEERQNALFDKKLAEEEKWIRQGIKARRTRNEGRVRALEAMRRERGERRNRQGTAKIDVAAADKSGRLVAQLKDVSYSVPLRAEQGGGRRTLVDGFSTLISRGDKVGVIGPNGAGKSTLLKLILGQLEPEGGSVRTGTNLQLAYFDQLREQIDETATAAENVGEGADEFEVAGKKRHVLSYLQDFLFAPDRARMPASGLSGGERNRLLLAKLFRREANLLVLDEPTNDLDSETLELLEELLAEFEGTVLLVSHDRAFLNNVVTSTIALEGDGTVREFDGGYDDYLRQRPEKAKKPKGKRGKVAAPAAASKAAPPARKLSFKEQRELETLPATIEALEAEAAELQAAMADPSFFKRGPDAVAADTARSGAIGEELLAAYARWEELEG